MATEQELANAAATLGSPDDSLHDSKDRMTDPQKNRELSKKLAGSWGIDSIGAIVRVEGDPRGRWDLYRRT